MNKDSLLFRLLVILFVCITIFAVRIFFFKQSSIVNVQVPAPGDTSFSVSDENQEIPAGSAGSNGLISSNGTISSNGSTEQTGPTVLVKGQTIKIAVVDTPAERQKGLSGHPGLKADEGLFFIFENSGRHGFWMKDMLFSIDILWIDSIGEIVHIQRNATPESYPYIFIPNREAKYVLEVVTGFTDAYNVSVGDSVEFFISNL